jgi:hypothetical protein
MAKFTYTPDRELPVHQEDALHTSNSSYPLHVAHFFLSLQNPRRVNLDVHQPSNSTTVLPCSVHEC